MTRNQFHSKALSSPLGSIDEEGDSILDESILDDSQTLDMAAPRFNPQQHAFSGSHFLSHGDEAWSTFPGSHDIAAFHPINPPTAQGAFLQPCQSQGHPAHPSHYPSFTEHPAPWQPINIDAKPRHGLSEGLPAQYDLKVDGSHHNMAAMPLPAGMPSCGTNEHHHHAPSMASPQSENGWLSASSSSESRKTPKREPISRNSFATFPQHIRREGIRKKNARVEIPEGRTIDTIEEEIRKCDPNDEMKLKELKQFKRLLRNREAALSSRSRKKEHAQRLEQENKALNSNFERYDEHAKLQFNVWSGEIRRLNSIIEQYVAKEEEMVRRHTLETAELRKKISFLTEETQRRADIPMSAVPSSAGFSNNTFSDFDPTTMGGSPQWDDFAFIGTSCTDTEVMKPQDSTLTVRQKEAKPTAKDDEPAVSGLLLMLLLCGAWVASSNHSKASPIPQMSEDVRAASAAVLTNIYKDAGLQLQEGPSSTFNNAALSASGSSYHPPQIFNNNLYDPHGLHHQLTAPTHQQECDQAFSLTSEQYNHLTTDWFNEQPKPASQSRRRNLADALANIHLEKRTTATNAYTKSLLMDEVPTNVVRDFHRMVAESGRRNGHPEPMS